jgi:hypothetical protein
MIQEYTRLSLNHMVFTILQLYLSVFKAITTKEIYCCKGSPRMYQVGAKTQSRQSGPLTEWIKKCWLTLAYVVYELGALSPIALALEKGEGLGKVSHPPPIPALQYATVYCHWGSLVRIAPIGL